jgi:citrate lyase subunit beta/citryl-CoA lyase
MRSLLFVPGDSPKKLHKALESGADALILDLEDSVAPDGKAAARNTVRGFLDEMKGVKTRPLLFVRVNALSSGLTDVDLDVVMHGAPEGIVLPKSISGQHVQHLSAKLAVREAENALGDGATRIITIATETAASIFHMGTYAGASKRLAGLTWGAEDLSAELGAETARTAKGAYTAPYVLARTLALLAAHAAEVIAIDTVFPNYRDEKALRQECEAARRDGFVAKLAIHPGQVGIINDTFTPSAAAITRARAIVSAFAGNASGVLGLNGEMLDRPHLRRAEAVLARAKK